MTAMSENPTLVTAEHFRYLASHTVQEDDLLRSLKKAAANAKDTEQAMIEAEQILDKAAKEAHTARQLARRLAAEAEAAAQAVDEAERALALAKKTVEDS